MKKGISSKKDFKTCSNGHAFIKSSDCPACPICEKLRKPTDGFISLLTAPARRALQNNGIQTLEQLSRFTENEILKFHGMGPGSIPNLRKALTDSGLEFKDDDL